MKTLYYLLIVLLCMSSIPNAKAQNFEKTFQQAMIQEEGEGDLEQAIILYNSIANNNSADRMLRARALFQIGLCYEKLGNQKAKNTYTKLISEYPDISEVISLAKPRLKGLKSANTIEITRAITVSQVSNNNLDVYDVSPNGRYLSYIDWESISVNIKDLKTGTTKRLTRKGTWEGNYQYPDRSVFSPDGTQLAYTWYNENFSELSI